MSSVNISSQYFTNESSIPPATPHSTAKPYKFISKKHLAINDTTTTGTSPQLTVIEQNFTLPLLDNDILSTATPSNQSYIENSTIREEDYFGESNTAQNNLSAAGITGITVGCIGIVGIICSVSFVVYRNRGLNRPQVLNDRCSNPDSSGYIDDASIRVIVFT